MGEEADADWQAGLSEWGEEETKRWLSDKMDEAMRKAITGPARKHRKTALRVRGRGFETVELDDAGKVIEPVRCNCGSFAITHSPRCPFAYMTV